MIPTLDNPAFCRLARSLIAEGMMVRCKAAGGSMFPAIRDGDLVTFSPVDPRQVKPGQVIAFETASGTLTIHRLVATGSDGEGLTFVTRGDARAGNDVPFGADQLVGRVVALEREGRPVAITDLARVRLARWRLRLRARLKRLLTTKVYSGLALHI